MSTTRLLLLIAALTNPFCWLPLIMTSHSAVAELKTGTIGAVFIPDSHERGRLPFDAPNRFLFWGQFNGPEERDEGPRRIQRFQSVQSFQPPGCTKRHH